MAECIRCGGYGGEDASHFGDHGWHPCFHCGTSGVCHCPECEGTTVQSEEVYDGPEPEPDDANYCSGCGQEYNDCLCHRSCEVCGAPDGGCVCSFDIDEQKEWEDFGERYDNDGPGDDWDF